jgi:hypothetical protein
MVGVGYEQVFQEVGSGKYNDIGCKNPVYS